MILRNAQLIDKLFFGRYSIVYLKHGTMMSYRLARVRGQYDVLFTRFLSNCPRCYVSYRVLRSIFLGALDSQLLSELDSMLPGTGFPTVRGDWRLSGPRMTVPSRACISEAWSVPVRNLNT